MNPKPDSSLPLFVVAGMPRSATTFLYHTLSQHPGVHVASRKETDFFNLHYDRGLDSYHSLFQDRRPDQVAGDFSPAYFLDRKAADRLAKDFPQARIILSIRDPAEYALSFYNQIKSFSYGVPPFSEFIHGYEYPFGGGTLRAAFTEDAIQKNIEHYRETFGENLLLFDYAHFKSAKLEVLECLERHIGLEPWFKSGDWEDLYINASSKKNIKALTYLLSRDWIVSGIERAVPSRLLKALHSKFNSASAGSNVSAGKFHDPADVELANQLLASQREWIAELFRDRPVQSGTGANLTANQS